MKPEERKYNTVLLEVRVPEGLVVKTVIADLKEMKQDWTPKYCEFKIYKP
jgi:hypothetical protein